MALRALEQGNSHSFCLSCIFLVHRVINNEVLPLRSLERVSICYLMLTPKIFRIGFVKGLGAGTKAKIFTDFFQVWAILMSFL